MALLLDILASGVIDSSGNPLDSGQAYVYNVGTSTLVDVFQDSDLMVAHTNPITLDSVGRAEAYTASDVRVLIKDSDGNTVIDIDQATSTSGLSSSTIEIGPSDNSGTISINSEFTSDLIPDVTNTYDIGSSSKKWADIYTTNVHATSLEGNLDNAYIYALGSNTPGFMSNLGITLSAGVLTITDAQGDALSTSNPGYITVPSTTAGQFVILKVTSPYSFTDDTGLSDLTNFGFGITEAADWAQDVPFFLYVINKGNTDLDGANGSSVFALARTPTMATSPSSANNIGDTDAISVTDDKTSILIMASVTEANYTSLPAQLAGGIRMQWSTTTDDWTVQTLGNKDGLGLTQIDRLLDTPWTMPTEQNGASASTYLLPNGGTAPVFSSNSYNYRLQKNGFVDVDISLSGDGGADGSGAVASRISLPMKSDITITNLLVGSYSAPSAPSSGDTILLFLSITSGNAYGTLVYSSSNGATSPNIISGNINLSSFSNGTRTINAKFSYFGF